MLVGSLLADLAHFTPVVQFCTVNTLKDEVQIGGAPTTTIRPRDFLPFFNKNCNFSFATTNILQKIANFVQNGRFRTKKT